MNFIDDKLTGIGTYLYVFTSIVLRNNKKAICSMLKDSFIVCKGSSLHNPSVQAYCTNFHTLNLKSRFF